MTLDVMVHDMHSNVWLYFFLLLIPTIFLILIGTVLWRKRARLSYIFLAIGIGFLYSPLSFLIEHASYQKQMVREKQGRYEVIVHDLSKLCEDVNIDELVLTLDSNGNFSFNFRPCFVDREKGKWKWQDDLVGAYPVFELEYVKGSYFEFTAKDTLCLVGNGHKPYIIMVKRELE